MQYKLLVINPGSTSTKIGVFEDDKIIFEKTLRHSAEEINKYKTIYEQYPFRKKVIIDALTENNISIDDLSAVIGRGGLLRPIEGGTYGVNDKMLEDLKIGFMGEHASNLGGIIANEISKENNIPSYIVDPVVVDEMDEIAKVTGLPEIQRKSIFHALNQKAVAKRYAMEKRTRYESLNLIVVHMGGGTSVGAHRKGRVVDVNNALDGDGPFSPERTGGLPIGDLMKLSFSGKFTLDQMKKKINGNGGIVAYLGTNDFREVIKRADEGDSKAKLIYDAYIYQIGKEIGKCSAVLRGKVDAIILTGGIAYNKILTDHIEEMVSYISDIVVYPGEDELLALAQGGLRVLRGEEKSRLY